MPPPAWVGGGRCPLPQSISILHCFDSANVSSLKVPYAKWSSLSGKLNPLAFGIMKLSILCTVEDAKVSVDDLTEKIMEFEDLVQSVDVAAFNKV